MMDICGTVANVAPDWLRVEVGVVLIPCLLMHIYGSALQATTGTDTKLLGFCESPVSCLMCPQGWIFFL